MDEQVNPLERDHSLSVVLPGGMEKSATVHGSKPVMDLLVTLCASYHLNPSDYTVEVLSPNKNNINFKPNSPIGSLEAEKIVLKPRGVEEKIRRPYMPEASVRLLINYNKSHKAVVRVNPRVPLEVLLPVVCDKCEFQVETTVLLRDSQSKETLDLTKTLNDHGLREVFAKDTAGKEPTDHQHQPKTPEAAVTPTEVISPPPLQDLPKKEKKQKENTGFLSLFRRRKKKAEREGARSAPASPGLIKQGGVNNNEQGVSPCNTLPTDMPKKRRAPQPPMGASQSVPDNLGTCHIGGSQRSAESTLKRTKRRAPPPPCANSHQELQADTQVKGTVNSLNTVEELRESEESDYVNLPLSSSSSPHPSHPRSSSSRPSFAHLHEAAEPYLPSFRGKDLSDARCALAKILTSSVSKGTLVKRLSNSATFSKLHTGSSYMSATQRCSDNGVFCAELEPVITSNLPTENDWEDPVHRKGMTTFKVVPAKKPKSHDPEVSVEDNPESEASPKVETEEDLCPPDRLEAETPPQSPEPSHQTSDRPAYLSPPLHHQDSPGSPLSEADEKQMEEDEPEDTTEVTAAAQPDCIDGELTSDVQINSEDQTELQSLNGQSGRADVDHCGSYTDEEEVEEVVVQEEDDDVKEAEEVVVQEDDDDEREAEEEVVQKEDDVKEEAEEEVVQKEDDVKEEAEEEVVQKEDDVKEEAEEEAVQKEDDVKEEAEEEVVQEEDDIKEEAEEEVVQEEDDIKEEAEEEVVQEEENDEKEVEEEMVQEGDEDEECFPPPPPPVFFDTEVMEAEREQTTASSLPSSVPPSPTSNGQTNAFSEDHENEPTTATATNQSAAAPKPLDKMSAAPSRFAQAVALAVQRSRLQSRGKSLGPQAPGGPHSTLPSPPRSTYQYGA